MFAKDFIHHTALLVMSVNTAKKTLDKIAKQLTAIQENREYLIKNSRQIIILCSQAIIAVHHGDLKQAKLKVKTALKLLKEYRKKAKGDLTKYLIIPQQEIVEAFSLIYISEKKEIPDHKKLGVTEEAYILGLLDCIGELKRLIYDKIRLGDDKEASRIFDIMEGLYHLLYPFATFDKILKDARRKLDVNRTLVEDARSALTEEIRRTELINAINKIKK